MSCISKINNTKNLTDTEKKISKYILSNSAAIPFETAKTLADKIQTSAAAIIRFSKKLGYSGFTQLKLDLAQETADTKPVSEFYSGIKERDELTLIAKKAEAMTERTIGETYRLINFQTLRQVVDVLKSAKTIYMYGVGASAICCNDLVQKLVRVGKRVVFFPDFHTQLNASYHITKDDAAIAISNDGKTREVITAVENAKEKGAKIISITQMNTSPLHKLSDYILFLPTLGEDLRLGAINSRNATLALTDLLYLGFIVDDLTAYKQYLTNTRRLTQQIKKR